MTPVFIIKKLVESKTRFLDDDILRTTILKYFIENNVSPFLIKTLKIELGDELERLFQKQRYNIDRYLLRARNEDRKMFWNTHIHGMSRDQLTSAISWYLYYVPTYLLISEVIDKIFKVLINSKNE
jgi:hypothetical protein